MKSTQTPNIPEALCSCVHSVPHLTFNDSQNRSNLVPLIHMGMEDNITYSDRRSL